uniref:Tetratricopeptide repeat protein 29 n=1 Tax=Geotrypetes seraphini TaxID=260995 RepID=A0A6P8QJQ4_GEOSA|nr:tetratricopeptide repeat protein 29 isoform X2 [Geotrypetes seraphini]
MPQQTMSALSALPFALAKTIAVPIQQPTITTKSDPKIERIHLIKDKDPKHDVSMDIKEFSKREAAVYRNSHKQNICIEMLQEGFHKSFREFFTLIDKWNALREAGGPGSDIWLLKPLDEQYDKLDQLQQFLTLAEAAQRAGRHEDAYKNYLALANYFKNSGNDWLADHFFQRCFDTAKFIKLDGGKREAEAYANLGLVKERHGQLATALEHYEVFYNLTLGRIWTDGKGHTQHSVACENLWRIYTLLADKMLENKEHQGAIKILIKAFEMAKEGGDNRLKGESAYRLGLAYLSIGKTDAAITFLKTYMAISKILGDNVGIGKANEALSKALESQGKILDSIQYLEKFIEIAKNNNVNQSLVESCICLGDIFNTRGRYEEAYKHFKKAYETACNLPNLPLLEETQVYYGIGQAHKMMMEYCNHTEVVDFINTKFLLEWKENRTDK